MLDLALSIMGLATLLAGASLLLPVAERVGAPYTVLLAAAGVALGGMLVAFPQAQPSLVEELLKNEGWIGADVAPENLDLGADFLRAMQSLAPPSDAFIYIFLPSLLFAAGLMVDARRLADDWSVVGILSVVAVAATTLAVGFAVNLVSDAGLIAALLLGSVVATTDPAAVIAIFRDIGAPRRLSIVVEGESLLNDAAAIAFFSLLLPMTYGESMDGGMIAAGVDFVIDLAGGALFGYLAARVAGGLIGLITDKGVVEITLTVALAYAVFIVAKDYLAVSGVVAVVVAAMTLGVYGRTQVSPRAWSTLIGVWEQLGFWSNVLIFSLTAMVVPRLLAGWTAADLLVLAALTFAALAARAAMLFGVIPVISTLGFNAPLSARHRVVIWWGALRGGVTLALALAVTENISVPEPVQKLIGIQATAFVLVTLFIKATTLRPLIRLLRLDRLSPEEQAVRDRVAAFSRAEAQDQAEKIAEALGAESPETGRIQAVEINDALAPAARLRAGLLALSVREAEIALRSFEAGTSPRRVADHLRADAERLADAATVGGLAGYEAAAQSVLQFKPQLQIALLLHRHWGLTRPLAASLARRFERLINVEMTLRELVVFVNASIKPLLGAETAIDLLGVLKRRMDGARRAREGFEVQFPTFANSVRKRYVERAALTTEENHYRLRHAESLISTEAFDQLMRGVRARRARLQALPELELGLEVRAMLARARLTEGISETEIAHLARDLRPRLATPGELIVRRGDRGKAAFFIASGEVEVRNADTARAARLGPGDVFGEIALLHDRPRTADVIARSFCQLLTLDARDFWALLRAHPELQARLERLAEMRLAGEEV